MIQFGDTRLPDRFWEKAYADPSGCWVWLASGTGTGYGQFYVAGRQGVAHRVSYVAFMGAIADDRQLDHLCRNRGCVNPAHLEAVTASVNQARGLLGFDGPTNGLCRRRHDTRLPGGLYIQPSTGERRCAACIRRHTRLVRANWTDQQRAAHNETRRQRYLRAKT